MDPQWLTNVMSSVVTLRHNIVREGKLRHCDLLFIWKPPAFPPSVHPILIKLLTKFDILYPIKGNDINDNHNGLSNSSDGQGTPPAQRRKSVMLSAPPDDDVILGGSGAGGSDQSGEQILDNAVSLVPCLLARVRPFIVKNYWPLYESEFEQTSRIWEFRFLPLGFFSRLFVRTMNLVDQHNLKGVEDRLDVITYWYSPPYPPLIFFLLLTTRIEISKDQWYDCQHAVTKACSC